MSKVIVVVGATGTQGGSVARTFSKLPNWEVRGITRNVDSPAAVKLKEELGVKLVKADLDDVESLKTAFAGAHAIFGVTDFWQFVQSPSIHQLAAVEGITWNEACYRQELQQGKNIIDAAAHVVVNGALERLVLSSLSDATKASKGKYTWVYHFDSKAHFVQYLKHKAEVEEEPRYCSLFDKTSYVQIGNYLENWKRNPIFMPKKSADGSVVFPFISNNFGNDDQSAHLTPFVHPPTDTGPFVQALVLKAPPRLTMLGTCGLLRYTDYVAKWGKANGVQTVLNRLSLSDVETMWPGGFGIEVGQTACYTREFGWDGGEGAILPEQAGVDLSSLSSVDSYIKNTDWSPILG